MKVYESKVPLGATPEYLSGLYILQTSSSLLPVMALAPKYGERILDLSAAPGVKTTHIGQILKNTGVILANDISKERIHALNANIARMGISNCVTTQNDGRFLSKTFINFFDRVLLDAPCSGIGVVYKDSNIKLKKTTADFKK